MARDAIKNNIDRDIKAGLPNGIQPAAHNARLKEVLDDSVNKSDDTTDNLSEGSTNKYASRDNVFDLIETNSRITKKGNLIDFDLSGGGGSAFPSDTVTLTPSSNVAMTAGHVGKYVAIANTADINYTFDDSLGSNGNVVIISNQTATEGNDISVYGGVNDSHLLRTLKQHETWIFLKINDVWLEMLDIDLSGSGGSGNPIWNIALSHIQSTALTSQQAPLFLDTGDAEPDWVGNASYLIYYVEIDAAGVKLENTRITNIVRGNQIRDGLKVKSTSDRPSSTGSASDFVIQDPSNTTRYLAKSAASGGNILINNGGQTNRFELRIYKMANSAGLPNSLDSFTDLSDTPDNLGTAGQQVRVNAGGNALEFFTDTGGGSGGGAEIDVETDASVTLSPIRNQNTDTGLDITGDPADNTLFFLFFKTSVIAGSTPGFTTALVVFTGKQWKARTNATVGTVPTAAQLVASVNTYTGSLDQIEIGVCGAADGSVLMNSDTLNETITDINLAMVVAGSGSTSDVTPPAAGVNEKMYVGSQNSNSFASYDPSTADNEYDVQNASYSHRISIQIPTTHWGYFMVPTDREPSEAINGLGADTLSSFTRLRGTVTIGSADTPYTVYYFQNNGRTGGFPYVVTRTA